MPGLYLARGNGPLGPRGGPSRGARPPSLGVGAQILPSAIVIACAGAASLFAVRSTVVIHPVANGVSRAVIVLSWGMVGLVTLRFRPRSRLGPVFIVLSCLYATTTLSGFRDPALFTVGRVAYPVMVLVLVAAFLVFPSGRFEDRASEVILSAAAVCTLIIWTALLLGARQLPMGTILNRCSHGCPSNAFRVFTLGAGLADGLGHAATLVLVSALVAATIDLLWRRGRMRAVRRRTLTAPAAVLAWGAAAAWTSEVARAAAGNASGLGDVLSWIALPALIGFPYAMLYGQLRGRLFAEREVRRATALVAEHARHADLRTTLVEALGDPTVQIGFEMPGRSGYVDTAGAIVDTAASEERAVTPIFQDDHPVAVIAHDAALDETPGLVRAAGDAALLVIENARLEAELRGTVDELRASRARIVTATEAERRRLEQDLHDSAQQRLVALRVRLGLAEDRAADMSSEMREVLADLGHEAEEAIDSVRAVAQGIYPPLLAGGGLARALSAESGRMPVQVHVAADEIGRAPAETEAAVYFCCLEALQNAVKHGGAQVRITIELHRQNGDLAFAVHDDGAGFDTATVIGTGLTHMRDRVGGVGGRLRVLSNPGAGTTVAGTVPWTLEAVERARTRTGWSAASGARG